MWTKSLRTLQSFDSKSSMEFLEKHSCTPRQESKGKKYHAEDYIHDVFINHHSVKAKCFRSQKKNDKPHNVLLNFEETNNKLVLSEAHCSCDAGNSQSCNHIVGLLYRINFLVEEKVVEIPEDISCTGKLMMWNRPRGKKITSEKVGEIIFTNPLKIKKKKDPTKSTFYNPLKSSDIRSSSESMELLKNNLTKINKDIPIISFLGENSSSSVQVKEGVMVPMGSLLSFHSLSKTTATTMAISEENVLDIQLPQTSSDTAQKVSKIFESKPKVISCRFDNFNLDSAIALEKDTRGQTNQLWYEARKVLLTASRFGEICKRRIMNDKFEEMLKHPKNVSHLSQIQQGHQGEESAKLTFFKNHNFTYFPCGLVVHPSAPHLGASPDGIVFEEGVGYGVLEIKTKTDNKCIGIEDACKLKNFCFMKNQDGEYVIKREHNFHYQIQGQMLISGLEWGILLIYFKGSGNYYHQRVHLDLDFCKKMYESLYYVYNMYFP